MLLSEIFFNRKVVVLNEEVSAQDAARAMRDNRIGCVVIIDSSRQISGIVTDRDFACRLVSEFPNNQVPISRIMTRDVVTADVTMSLNELIQLMENYGLRRIPIVNRLGNHRAVRCVGIVTLDDLVAGKQIDSNVLSRVIRRQFGNRPSGQLGPQGLRSANSRGPLRSGAHKQHTLDKFYRHLAEGTNVDIAMIPQIASYLLGNLAMRVTFLAKEHFIAQLPQNLQEGLLRLPPGPDRGITIEKMQDELKQRFKFTDEFVQSLLPKFFQALQAWLGAGQVKHLKAQLPEELRSLFKSQPPQTLSPPSYSQAV